MYTMSAVCSELRTRG